MAGKEKHGIYINLADPRLIPIEIQGFRIVSQKIPSQCLPQSATLPLPHSTKLLSGQFSSISSELKPIDISSDSQVHMVTGEMIFSRKATP